MVKSDRSRDWIKVWTNHYSLFTAGLFATEYTLSMKKIIGRGFKKIYLESNKDLLTIYRPNQELIDFSSFLARRSINENKFYLEVASNLFGLEKQIKSFTKLKPKNFLNQTNILAFIQIHNKLLPYYLVPLWAVNGISKLRGQESRKRKVLEFYRRARMDTEFLYKDIELYLDQVFRYIARKENIKYLLARSLLPGELINYSKSGKLPSKNLVERSVYSVIVASSRGSRLYTDDRAKIIISKIAHPQMESGELDGQPVFKAGLFKGIVKRAERLSDVKLAKANFILVTPMTQPDWVPYLKKFKAFVTDVGGTLCHAAIVAREMKKPCVIGTKFASQVFKDGDLIEVDANRGIVRILKKA